MIYVPPVSLQEDNSTDTDPLYFDRIMGVFNLTSDELALLNQNDFIVLNRKGTDDILDAYHYYWENDLPIFLTTDTILQTWHLIFDEKLIQLEEQVFYPLLSNLTRNMLEEMESELLATLQEQQYNDVLIYFSVAILLVNESYPINPLIKNSVLSLYNAIMDETPFFEAKSILDSDETSLFIDDFSQYKPRGHYTKSEALQTYFRLFKWLSRISFFFEKALKFRSSEQMMHSALTVTWFLKHTSFDFNQIHYTGFDVWNAFNTFLNTVVGKTYTISPHDIDELASSSINNDWYFNKLTTQNILDIKDVINTDPKYATPKTIPSSNLLGNGQSKHFTFFGERLTLDTYALNNLVDPYVQNRFLPNGLDFAVTMLNSNRALQISEPNYFNQIEKVKQDINNWDVNDKNTVVMNWIDSLSELVEIIPENSNSSNVVNLPAFMKSVPWLDEKLTTVLGSWAQLKHDTILYAKQGYTSITCSTPGGFVEPYPLFYQKLNKINTQFKQSIMPFNDFGVDLKSTTFDLFSSALNMLEGISISELSGKILSETQKNFINTTFSTISMGSGPIFIKGWLGEILGSVKPEFDSYYPFPNSRASLIADIHTDLNSQRVLEVATGYLEHLIAKVPGFNGTEIFAVGPVFSYYEFLTNMDNRMADQEWRGILKGESNNDNPVFENTSIRGFWSSSYMASTAMTVDIIYRDYEVFSIPEWYSNGQDLLIQAYSESILNHYKVVSLTSVPDINDLSVSLEKKSNTKSPLDFALLSLPFLILIALRRRKKY